MLVEDLEHLLLVGLRIGVDLLAGKRFAGHVAAGGISDERCKVSDQKNDLVAELLKVAQLAHQYGMPEVQVRRGGIETRLYAKGAARLAAVFEALAEVAYADDFRRALLQQVHLLVYW